MRQRRELQPAVALRDNHPEKALFPQELPHLLGQIFQILRDLPVVDEGTELFNGTLEKGLLFGAQMGSGGIEQLFPIGVSLEQFAVPPDGAGIQCLLFGARNLGQNTLKCGEYPLSDQGAA